MRVHFCIHNRTAEVFSLSLDHRLVHSVLSRYFSASLYSEVHMLPDSHHLLSLDFHHRAHVGKFILQLGLQLESALPTLLALTWPLRFEIDHRLLDLPRRSRFQLRSRSVTCRPLRFLRLEQLQTVVIIEQLGRCHDW